LKIAVIGSSGLLGEGFLHISKKIQHDIIGTHFEKEAYQKTSSLDIRKKIDIEKFLKVTKPDLVINASAITNPEACEKDPKNTFKTNVEGTKNLANSCNENGIHFVQISTEYVFNGKAGPCKEIDTPNPLSVYGKSKLESEKATLEVNPKFCVVRTAMLFGWSKNKMNLATFLISNLRNNNKVKVITDQIVSPSYNNNIAEMVAELAAKKSSGIFHVAGSSIVSRFEFAKTLAKVFKLDGSLIEPTSISGMGWSAKRPLNGGLIVEKISKEIISKPLTLEKSLMQMAHDESFHEKI